MASDGGVFNYGTGAPFLGSLGGTHLNAPIVGIGTMPAGDGYYLVASDGGVFAYGSAQFYGSMGGKPLNKPIVGMAVTPDGGGYWLVASDGGVFAFGDAQFFGSAGSIPLNKPVVGIASAPNGLGYWIVASDGGVFNYGSAAPFFGSTGGVSLNKPVVAIGATTAGQYYLVASDGGIFAYPTGPSGPPFYGSTGSLEAEQADRRDDHCPGRLLPLGLRRRHLRLPDRRQRTALLRLDRRHQAQRTDRGGGQLTSGRADRFIERSQRGHCVDMRGPYRVLSGQRSA